ncbi:MAG: flavodoxin domain-containing protein [Marinifilaceae bacterium]
MKKILITYYSESGSTGEIAHAMARQMNGSKTEVIPQNQVTHLNYDTIVIGTPNRYGKPASQIIKFLKQKKTEIGNTPVLLYYSCMDCYNIPMEQKVDIFTDSHFQNNTKELRAMNSWEKSHSVPAYLSNINRIAPDLNLVSLAFFKGRLNFKSLSFFNSLVMRLVCMVNKDIKEGDFLKHQDIHLWCKHLASILN